MIEAWASLKSYRPKEPPVGTDGALGTRLRDRFGSITDPEARLYRTSKSRVATLSYLANALMDNRHGLLADLSVGIADGFCEREQALAMLAPRRAKSVGADKAYDTKSFVAGCAALGVEAHVTENSKHHNSAVDRALLDTERYRTSQRVRKRIEEIFGWFKTVAIFRRTRYRGRARTELSAQLIGAAYNLLRIAKLCPSG